MNRDHVIQFLLMSVPTLAVCWLVVAGAGRLAPAGWLARVVAIATLALWLVFPWEQSFSGEGYSIYLAAMALFQAGIVVTGVLAFLSRPPWPGWIIAVIRIAAVLLALAWGFNLVFMLGVLLSQ